MLCSHRRRSLEERKWGSMSTVVSMWHGNQPGTQHLTYGHPFHPAGPPRASCQTFTPGTRGAAPRQLTETLQKLGHTTSPRAFLPAVGCNEQCHWVGCPDCALVVRGDRRATVSGVLLTWTCSCPQHKGYGEFCA